MGGDFSFIIDEQNITKIQQQPFMGPDEQSRFIIALVKVVQKTHAMGQQFDIETQRVHLQNQLMMSVKHAFSSYCIRYAVCISTEESFQRQYFRLSFNAAELYCDPFGALQAQHTQQLRFMPLFYFLMTRPYNQGPQSLVYQVFNLTGQSLSHDIDYLHRLLWNFGYAELQLGHKIQEQMDNFTTQLFDRYPVYKPHCTIQGIAGGIVQVSYQRLQSFTHSTTRVVQVSTMEEATDQIIRCLDLGQIVIILDFTSQHSHDPDDQGLAYLQKQVYALLNTNFTELVNRTTNSNQITASQVMSIGKKIYCEFAYTNIVDRIMQSKHAHKRPPTPEAAHIYRQHFRFDREEILFYRRINFESLFYYQQLSQTGKQVYYNVLRQYLNYGRITDADAFKLVQLDFAELKQACPNITRLLKLEKEFRCKGGVPNAQLVLEQFVQFLLKREKLLSHGMVQFDELGGNRLDEQTSPELEGTFDLRIFLDLMQFCMQINNIMCLQHGENVYYFDGDKKLQIINVARTVIHALERGHMTHFYFNYMDLDQTYLNDADLTRLFAHVQKACQTPITQLSKQNYYAMHNYIIRNGVSEADLFFNMKQNITEKMKASRPNVLHGIEYLIEDVAVVDGVRVEHPVHVNEKHITSKIVSQQMYDIFHMENEIVDKYTGYGVQQIILPYSICIKLEKVESYRILYINFRTINIQDAIIIRKIVQGIEELINYVQHYLLPGELVSHQLVVARVVGHGSHLEPEQFTSVQLYPLAQILKDICGTDVKVRIYQANEYLIIQKDTQEASNAVVGA